MSTWLPVTGKLATGMIHRRMDDNRSVLPTGLPSIDKSIYLWGDRRGMPRGSYVLVGGASNVGKTLFGMHLLIQAGRAGEHAGLISLDMKNRDAIARIMQSMVTEIDFKHWQPSKWQAEYRELLNERMAEIDASLPGTIQFQGNRYRDLHRVVEYIRHGAKEGITVFIVDHLQKIRVTESRGDVFTTADVVSETMDDLVDELDVTIVGLSQLNRNASRETDRSPTMFDLHGGTSMESNAAFVFMLDHSLVAKDKQKPHILRTWLKFEKNQMGPKNIRVPILVDAAQLSVMEGLPHEEHMWPERQTGKRR